MTQEILIKFAHGLGDCVQLSTVLKHLRKYRPDWRVDVRCGHGKHTALIGLCRRVISDHAPAPKEESYQTVVDLGWWENYCKYSDRPNSKVTNCLKEVFHLDWDESLGRYEIAVSAPARSRAEKWLEGIGAQQRGDKYRAVLLHFQGNTSPSRKNLAHWQARRLVDEILRIGRVPVILDWDKRSTLPDGKTIFCPGVSPDDIWGGFGSGDAETLAALIGLCEAFLGIDSGPGKVASATETPTLISWIGHHPLQFHDPAANTTHLIPAAHREMAPWRDMAAFFDAHYKSVTYANDSDLVTKAGEWLMNVLGERVTPVTERPMTFLLPSGIGDSMWALLKIRGVAGDRPIDIALSGDPGREIDNRCVPFLKRFSFIRSVRVEDVPILLDRDHPGDEQGRYRYKPDGRDGEWHVLAPNGPLERGQRIETWLPEIPCDWAVIKEFSLAGTERGTREGAAMEPFCAFYLGPESGHCDEGHNWGWLWEPKHWVQLGLAMKRRGLKVCVVGAKYDRSFWERYVRDGVEEAGQVWEDRIGEFEIGDTFAFLQRAKFLIGYQSGLSIVHHYLGGRGASWWRPDGNSGHPGRMLSFDERMKDSWIRPGWEQNWLGLVYKKETVADVVKEIDRRGWCE